MLWRGCGEAESARTWKGSSMYGSLTTEAKSACSAASRTAFTAVTITWARRALPWLSLRGRKRADVRPRRDVNVSKAYMASAQPRHKARTGELGFHRRSTAHRPLARSLARCRPRP